MNETAEQTAGAEYVLSKSMVCRRFRKRSRALAVGAVDYLGSHDVDEPHARDGLREHLRLVVMQQKLGNPILIWILLNIVIPIVIRLIIEWWKNR